MAALEGGKHVLCEKPIAITTDEVDAIVSAAQETGMVITEAFMYRHHPQTLKVQYVGTQRPAQEGRVIFYSPEADPSGSTAVPGATRSSH